MSMNFLCFLWLKVILTQIEKVTKSKLWGEEGRVVRKDEVEAPRPLGIAFILKSKTSLNSGEEWPELRNTLDFPF